MQAFQSVLAKPGKEHLAQCPGGVVFESQVRQTQPRGESARGSPGGDGLGRSRELLGNVLCLDLAAVTRAPTDRNTHAAELLHLDAFYIPCVSYTSIRRVFKTKNITGSDLSNVSHVQ